MARWYLIVMAIAFFICLIEAAPAQEDNNTNKVQEDLNNVYESLKQTFENISKDPKIQDLVQKGRELLEELKQGADKIIPKTGSPPSS
ncbi:uncharacterized protein LOC135164685 [Diachasmimorpha longicaudata]|uniref:uncharacterized protein LOC135164685 n=1 Tax=Diachasmimorpha longicaudata TaxID=58733 RepID=UPI0030B8E7CA